MKNLVKKYYELNNEIKVDFEQLYIYHKFTTMLNNYKNIGLKDINEQERILQLISKCNSLVDFSLDTIINQLLITLSGPDITVEDLEKLDTDELIEVIFSEDTTSSETLENPESQEIIAEFIYRQYYCIFCKNKEKYILILLAEDSIETVSFNSLEDIFNDTIDKILLEKRLYG